MALPAGDSLWNFVFASLITLNSLLNASGFDEHAECILILRIESRKYFEKAIEEPRCDFGHLWAQDVIDALYCLCS